GLIRKLLPPIVSRKIETAYRWSRGLFWQALYGFPARGISVIAVTGTNGKSTTCVFINSILKSAGYKTAMLTTPLIEIAGKQTSRTTTRTLEKQSEVQAFFSKAKRSGADWVILEVPSHALDQNRIMGVRIKTAVVTNLTPEHLDYHKTMENYARAKSLLTTDYGASAVVLNRDDKWFDYFSKRARGKLVSVGKDKSGDIMISDIKLSANKSSAVLSGRDVRFKITTDLLGEFNIYNASQAAATGLALNLAPDEITAGIRNVQAVPGRMEPLMYGQKFAVLVDYAITPDAIEKALKTLRRITKGKVRIVFGATGNRDRQKRPLMGQAAGKYADVIYLTDDETYDEKSEDIIAAVYAGIKKAKATGKTKLFAGNRREAIRQALVDAKPNDAVYITGLGHEKVRNMGGKFVPWSDQQVTAEILRGKG
ncbi:MAG TPA: UDP-N-acetylmuramoyl-L-alanyl-D-glutamate--2,6-diaminopimelate ligase, partial [Candidatus Saccharimonadales bacterium]|nr:UDP-N-acetylmuramoyl-L-alanyl-D-glutamate--2,6-diaminopimelate ligase [Candidatus Saccharimonadales bacterium]